MPIQSFITWVTGNVVTAAQLNEQIRDNGNELSKGGLSVIFDGGGAALDTDVLILVPETPYKLTIDAATLMSTDSATSDNFIVDIRVPAVSSNAPAATDTITASATPQLDTDNATYNRDTTLTGWTTTISEGFPIGFYIESNGGITKGSLSLTWTRAS